MTADRFAPTALAAALGGVLGLLAPAAPAAAGSIRLDLGSECRVAEGLPSCSVEIHNRGNEAADRVEVEIEGGGVAWTSASVGRLEPGGSGRVEMGALAPMPEGRRPVVVRVAYRDRNGYPLSVVGHGFVGDRPTPAAPVAATLRASRLGASDALVLDLRNLGDEPVTAEVTPVLPREIESDGPLRLVLHPGDSVALELPVRSAGALPGSSYRVYALLDLETPGRREWRFAGANLRVERPRSVWEGLRLPAVSAFAAFAVLGLGLCVLGPPSRRAVAVRLLAVAAPWIAGAGIVALLASVVPPDLLLSPTTTTGGDTASHFYAARQMVEELLPQGRILGWSHGNLAGFPLFQLYFPLPFLAMAALEPAVGLAVAFKLGTVLGVVLLPLAAALCLRRLGFPSPAPLLGAAFTLPFLLNEAHSVWGGNLASVFAGEFAYSLGLALAVAFVGLSYDGLRRGRGVVANALLLAAVGLAHAYTLLFAGALSALHLLWLPDPRRGVAWLVRVWALAFALLGFWIVPLLAYAPFTTPLSEIWGVESWRQLVPVALWAPLAIGVVSVGTLAARRRRGDDSGWPVGGGVLWSAVALATALHLAAPALGVVDIRFLPFLQLFTLLAAAGAAGVVLRRWHTAPAVALVLAAVVLGAAEQRVERVPDWAWWNYSGFEAKPLWPDFAEVNRRLAGSANDPRVVYEHHPAHDGAGSIRAFESLPHFSGRSTLEGLYIQSSLNTPAIFYVQSELSEVASCPIPDYHCGRLDVDRAAQHLAELNVDRVVAVSARVREDLVESDLYDLDFEVGPYSVHRLRAAPGGYAVPLGAEPVVLTADDWKAEFFDWFKGHQPGDPVVVRDFGAVTRGAFELRAASASDPLPHRPLVGDEVEVEAELGAGEIVVRTSRPGHPVLVRVSWHPRWRLEDGGPVHLAAPGFMVIEPRSPEVRLVFGDPPLVRGARALTLGGVVLAVLGLVAGSRRRRDRVEAGSGAPRLPLRWAWAAGPLLVALVAVGALPFRSALPSELWEEGLEHYKLERFAAARAAFDQAVEVGPRSSAALHADFYRALSAYREESWEEARMLFAGMARRFPESPYRAEAEYHVGVCLRRLGRPALAAAAFRELLAHFPETPWAGFAGERLNEIEAPRRPTV